MKNVITVLLVILVSLPALSSYQHKEKSKLGKTTVVDTMEVMPWPWATQCPFPWDTISGHWKVVADNVDMSFVFKVVNQSDVGELYLAVREYNNQGELVAKGFGVSSSGSFGVRAAMKYVNNDDQNMDKLGYWLHISAFVEKGENKDGEGLDNYFACYERVNKTAIKITEFGKAQDNEAPLLIEKMTPRKEESK